MKLLFNNTDEFWSEKELKELKTPKIKKLINKIFKRK